ncbi:MAG: type I DNA topoisomerase [Chitinophagaceae bacterium]|nr:type I DNA topoisomerase [Chitinophagaceae bacterium]MBK8605550.1 type I DNA topoisomerase [Chitinophagaceae bacterium]MBP6477044.1 type I DNA topoisomerase [Chitinophagaceae bacterium]MBP7108730.1 type I DNA topoisomerase [Chitinophagaceae bacterium]MBP7314304.1 type I DNA topoisomerase [Chitinophagaceae bacterium]
MAKNLLIVESPAKAKTIEKILGSDFQVKSCFGHIRDLQKAGMGIDLEKNFEPTYIISPDKEKVVAELKKLASKSQEVWLATDEDREGEAISWHLCEVLGLDPKTTKRIVFHEITKPAIKAAVENPRTLDMNLVMAQQARRILDRIVGFELSPILWRKMSMRNNLSAGRVQSVAVRIIAEREREINAFNTVSTFKIEGLFTAKDVSDKAVTFSAEGKKQSAAEGAEAFLKSCIGADYKVNDIQVKPGKRTPAPPFTTSTLQQEASRKLGYGVARTMQIAQKLYENGYITYMRTDSVNLSNTALGDITNTVKGMYGDKYHQFRKYKNKNENAQEAHEAIRPTYASNPSIQEAEWAKLYELIWKRTMASQMADAELEKTTAKISISTNKEELTASGEVLKFDGFLKVYREDKDEDELEEDANEGMLPPLTVGQQLPLKEMKATERFSRPPARYTEASLVKKLEELGIGRPSTYAPTISTVLKRGYVEKRDKEGTRRDFRVYKLLKDNVSKVMEQENTGAEKSKLFPSDLGLVVTDFLKQYFDDIMDYGFTAKIEGEFDEVAEGKMKWNKMIDDFYLPFKKDVENTIENAERIKGERELGVDPESGKPVVARMGRYGAMIQIGVADDEEKPRFAKVPTGQSIETITFEEAMNLFGAQGSMGLYEEKEVSVNVGRFGPYVKWGDEFVSLPRGTDLQTVDFDTAVEHIKQKQIADAPVGTYNQKTIIKGKGRFGPYIKWDGMFINVPARYKFDSLTQAEMDELITAKVKKEENRYIHRWEDENISVENDRWAPIIKFGKKKIRLPKKKDDTRYTPEEAAAFTLEDVKGFIEAEIPGAFAKKAKKATAKKKVATKKKAAPKKKK